MLRVRRSPVAALVYMMVIVAMAFTLVPATGAHAQTTPFPDIAGNAHEDNIRRLAATSPPIAGGFTDGRFRPSLEVTRAQMASFVARRLGLPTAPTETGFLDVPAGYVHSGAIHALAEAGITTGYVDGTFKPEASISREHMAVFLERAFRDQLGTGGSAEVFTDIDRYQDEIGAIVAARITEGATATTYRPSDPVRRDQMASFLARTLDLGVRPQDAVCIAGTTDPSMTTIGTALPGLAINHAVEHDGLVYLMSMDIEPAMILVYDPVERELARDPIRFQVGQGRRTWAAEVVDDTLYVGQHNLRGTNLFAVDLTASNPSPRPVARVPDATEFWDLTSDEEGRLYAARWAPTPEDQDYVVYRIDPDAPGAPEVTAIPFEPPAAGGRHEVTSLVYDDGALVAGLRGRGGTGRARVLEIHLEEWDGQGAAPTTDLDPTGQVRGQGVYSLAVFGDDLLVGTQATTDVPAMFARFEREPFGGDPEERRGFMPNPRQLVAIPDEGAISAMRPVTDDDGYLIAGNTTGAVYLVRNDAATTAAALGRPVVNTPVRALLAGPANSTVGVTSSSGLWQMTSVEPATFVTDDLIALGAPGTNPVRPQSMERVGDHLVVAGNNALVSHDLRTGRVAHHRFAGEAKAMTTDGEVAYIATYPQGQLWRFDLRSGVPTEVAAWDEAENRPWDVVWDAARAQVIVTTQSDYRRFGSVIMIDPNHPVPDQRVRRELRQLAGNDTPSRHGRTVAVVADRLLVGSNGAHPTLVTADPTTGAGRLIDLGRDLGPIQRIVGDGTRAHVLTERGWWLVVNARTGGIYRRQPLTLTGNVGDMELRDGMLHIATSTQIVTVDVRTGTQRTVQELDPVVSYLNRHNAIRLDGSGANCGAHVMSGTDVVRVRYLPWPR